MSLLPPAATLEEKIQDFFVSLRGNGLMLSPLDVGWASKWAAAHVPFEVIARGISAAHDRLAWDRPPGERVLRSLAACRPEVESEIARYRARAAGAGSY